GDEFLYHLGRRAIESVNGDGVEDRLVWGPARTAGHHRALRDELQAAVGEVPVQLLLHLGAVAEQQLAADAAGEVEEGIRGANEGIGRLVEEVAVLDG